LRERRFDRDNAHDAADLLNYAISHVIGRAPTMAKFVLAKRKG
jgi:hypothetical protein